MSTLSDQLTIAINEGNSPYSAALKRVKSLQGAPLQLAVKNALLDMEKGNDEQEEIDYIVSTLNDKYLSDKAIKFLASHGIPSNS